VAEAVHVTDAPGPTIFGVVGAVIPPVIVPAVQFTGFSDTAMVQVEVAPPLVAVMVTVYVPDGFASLGTASVRACVCATALLLSVNVTDPVAGLWKLGATLLDELPLASATVGVRVIVPIKPLIGVTVSVTVLASPRVIVKPGVAEFTSIVVNDNQNKIEHKLYFERLLTRQGNFERGIDPYRATFMVVPFRATSQRQLACQYTFHTAPYPLKTLAAHQPFQASPSPRS